VISETIASGLIPDRGEVHIVKLRELDNGGKEVG
jgi:hypothetical protein